MTSTKEVPCYECGESIQVSGPLEVIMDLDGDLCSTCLDHLPDDLPCPYRIRDLTALECWSGNCTLAADELHAVVDPPACACVRCERERLSEADAYRREAEPDHWHAWMGRGYRAVRHLYRRVTYQYR